MSPRSPIAWSYLAPWQATDNLGDRVIEDAIKSQMRRLDLPTRPLAEVPTHHRPSRSDRQVAGDSKILILGGTNILSGRMELHRQWLLTPDLVRLYGGKVVLVGVGWWQYQDRTSRYTRWVLSELLHPTALHSVRDSYSRDKLTQLGHRAVNTSCPTLWDLPQLGRECARDEVVITVTDYKQDASRDALWLQHIRARFARVWLQPMSLKDGEYAVNQLGFAPSQVLPFSLDRFDQFLAEHQPAVVGTRLHAGIRSMRFGCRTVILAVDNRASEIAKDTGIPVCETHDLSGIDRLLDPHITSSWTMPRELERNRAEFLKNLVLALS